ncbi:MAG TPA: DUF1446 domain-containing protein [Planctomycetes bacterium]|nr:DUF1446 domain-containing protein [Planctomycetota bacterium]
MTEPIRIGNASGFWGDRILAAADLVLHEPNIDFITLDFLAEVSMSIMAIQRERDTSRGYAHEFVDVVRSLVPHWKAGSTVRLVTNAGGLEPLECGKACAEAMAELGCPAKKIAIVDGDDILHVLTADPQRADFSNMDTGKSISQIASKMVTANAYLGAQGIADALDAEAQIVITGRVADPSLAVGPCVHHFGWKWDDYDCLAGATIAGHLIECGTQVCGGISTNWLEIPNVADIGFPIVEVEHDGSCIVTKPPPTGGLIDEQTVKEQLLYEIGDPENLLTPDVTVSMTSIAIEDLGHDRVKVDGAIGKRPSNSYKVSATYRNGFRAQGSLTIFGCQAVRKAQRAGEALLTKLSTSGIGFDQTLIECLGTGDAVPLKPRRVDTQANECVLRVAVLNSRREQVEQFSREFAALVTSGPQGTTGYSAGRPRVQPVFGFWPCLIDKKQISVDIQFITAGVAELEPNVAPQQYAAREANPSSERTFKSRRLRSRDSLFAANTLGRIAYARSGDKGQHANVGVLAYTDESYEFLDSWLTAEVVAHYFSNLGVTNVVRYDLKNLLAFNFLLYDVLDGGGSQSMRSDAQGKALGQAILDMPLPCSEDELTQYCNERDANG